MHAGITVDNNGRRTIDKKHRRIRIFVRLSSVSQNHAEQRLRAEITRVELELQRKIDAHRFVDCATRYLVSPKLNELLGVC